jgi:hypothetical protein
MTSFSVGEQVVIRFGRQQGEKATIIKSRAAEVYEVKVLDGSILFFSGKGLQRQREGVQEAVS